MMTAMSELREHEPMTRRVPPDAHTDVRGPD
jgi:hypothetical protein